MTEVSFYHLTKSPMKVALPQLLIKVLESGKRAVLLLKDEARLQELDSMLWTFSTKKFVPHGTAKDGFEVEQPVFLTTEEVNPNNSDFLVVVDGLKPSYADSFMRVIDIFDGTDDVVVEDSRKRWAAYKKAKHSLTYWQQDKKGAWEQAG